MGSAKLGKATSFRSAVFNGFLVGFQGSGGRSQGLSPDAGAAAAPAGVQDAAAVLHVHRRADLRRGGTQLSRYLAVQRPPGAAWDDGMLGFPPVEAWSSFSSSSTQRFELCSETLRVVVPVV